MNDLSISPQEPDRFADQDSIVEIGQWYWVKSDDEPDDDELDSKWLGCITQIGSNYVEVSYPDDQGRIGGYTRIHWDDFNNVLTLEPEASSVIAGKVNQYKQEVSCLLQKVKDLTARLGISNGTRLENVDESNRSLSTLSGTVDVDRYKNNLIKAKEEDLPALFEKIESSNKELARWMSAESLPLRAVADKVKGCLAEVSDRIFNVTIYAGLTEQVVHVAQGNPASISDKVHLMQRLHYMDEECLLNYRHGGMDFKDIECFDKWIAEPENRDRILPFPRCIAAFRVRREEKEREYYDVRSYLHNIHMSISDKLTYLYIRNGGHLYRMSSDLQFDELIFPDKRIFDPSEPMMVKMFVNRVDQFMPVREYKDREKEWMNIKKQQEKELQTREQWIRDNIGKKEDHYYTKSDRKKMDNCPFGGYFYDDKLWRLRFNPDEWKPVNKDNVYFDECMKEISDQVKKYNRIALIIQGLLDRSEVLHPHPPAQIWSPDGFARIIHLVYDGTSVLYEGEEPDFEAYRQEGLAQLTKSSIVIGQEKVWMMREAEKENERQENDYRIRNPPNYKYYKPFGNPGPGYIAKMFAWRPNVRQAVFSWNREATRSFRKIRTTITVDASDLFNVSAYKPGDYKRFFQDPRSRGKYLEWAPVMLAAEEYYAGNEQVQEPV